MALRKAVEHCNQTSNPQDAAKELGLRLRKSLGSDPDLLFFFGAGPSWPESNMGKLIEKEFNSRTLVIGAVGNCTSQFGIINGKYSTQDTSPALSALAVCLKKDHTTRIAVFGNCTENDDPFGSLTGYIQPSSRLSLAFDTSRMTSHHSLEGETPDDDIEEWATWERLALRSQIEAPDMLLLTNTNTSSLMKRANLLLPHSMKVGGMCHSDTSLHLSGLTMDETSPFSVNSVGLIIDGLDQMTRLRLSSIMTQGPQPFNKEFVITSWQYAARPDIDGKLIAISSLDNIPIKDLIPQISEQFEMLSRDGVFYIGICIESDSDTRDYRILTVMDGDTSGDMGHPNGYMVILDSDGDLGKKLCANKSPQKVKFHVVNKQLTSDNFIQSLNTHKSKITNSTDGSGEDTSAVGMLVFSDVSRGEALYGEEDVESTAIQECYQGEEGLVEDIPAVGFMGLTQFGAFGSTHHSSSEAYLHQSATCVVIIK